MRFKFNNKCFILKGGTAVKPGKFIGRKVHGANCGETGKKQQEKIPALLSARRTGIFCTAFIIACIAQPFVRLGTVKSAQQPVYSRELNRTVIYCEIARALYRLFQLTCPSSRSICCEMQIKTCEIKLSTWECNLKWLICFMGFLLSSKNQQ